MKRSVWFYTCCAFGGLVALALLPMLDPWLFQVPWYLATGWFSFIARVVPQITWRWGAIVETGLIVAALGAGTHFFLRGFWRQRHAQQDGARDWPVRWSVSLVSLLVLLFLATMASVGIGHHVGWLSSSRAPLTESDWSPLLFAVRAGAESTGLCEAALRLTSQGVADAELGRALLADKDSREAMETRHVLSLRKSGGPATLLVFSRDPVARESEGLIRCEAGTPLKQDSFPANVLPRLLAGEAVPGIEKPASEWTDAFNEPLPADR